MERVKPANFIPHSKVELFNDDEPLDFLPQNIKNPADFVSNYYANNPFSLSIKAIQQTIKPNEEKNDLPFLISARSADLNKDNLDSNAYIDLILVIDHSGSMEGKKIYMVKKSIFQMLEYLREHDRISIVMFDNKAIRLMPLVKNNQKNRELINTAINYIEPDGGTNIHLGVEFAFQILKRRKYRNTVSSIMLLSDGLDDECYPLITESLAKINLLHDFTLHTFGFGADHDPILMSEIAGLKNGSFYYVEKEEILDEVFVDCLGGLLSVVGVNAKIDFEIMQNPKIFGPNNQIKLKKIFGNTKKITDNSFSISIPYIIYGMKKDFVAIMEIPKLGRDLQDHEKYLEMGRTQLVFERPGKNKEKKQQMEEIKEDNENISYNIQKILYLTILNKDEEVKDYEKDEDVEINYLRVLAAEKMEEARNEADKGNLQEGINKINAVLEMAMKSKRKNNQEIMDLASNLGQAQKMMQPKIYEQKGRQFLECNKNAAMKQQSHPGVSEGYANSTQKRMVKNIRSKKN